MNSIVNRIIPILAITLCFLATSSAVADLTGYRNAVNAQPSLLSFYTFENNFNDATGTHNGTGVNNAVFGTGVANSGDFALSVNADGYVDLGNSTDFHFADNSGTISAFLKPSWNAGGAPANPGWFGTRTDTPHASRYSLHVRNQLNALDKYSSGVGVANAGATLVTNEWAHVAIVIDGGVSTFYLNGQPLNMAGNNGALGGTNASTTTQIGASAPTNANEMWRGSIDELAVYNDALSANDILAQYNAFNDVPPPPPPPVTDTILSWTFEGDGSGTLADTTGAVPFSLVLDGGTAFDRDSDGDPSQPIRYDESDANNPQGGGAWLVRSDYAREDGQSNKPGDNPQGILETSAFTLAANASVEFDTGGAGGVFQVVEAGTNQVLAEHIANHRSVSLTHIVMDLSDHAGKSAYFRIHDNVSGGWGHIAIDNINYKGSNIIPEPTSLALISLASTILIRRRR